MGSRSIGTTVFIPSTAPREQVDLGYEIPKGSWLYLDSGLLVNGATGDNAFYIGETQGDQILKGDLSITKNQILAAFKEQEPNSTIEVTWLELSWSTFEYAYIGTTTGYRITDFRIKAVVKNVSAGLAPIIIAAIIAALPLIIAVVALTVTIAWTAYVILGNPNNPFNPIMGLVVLVIIGALFLVVIGGGGTVKHKSTSISLTGRKG